ncbi:MAG: hypothetical protein WA214_22260 [Pseudolabrys sp.]|jgi:hypothetical protein
MSRKNELLKLAQLFHSQARLTLDRPAKQALRKLGDRYQNEAKKLQGQVLADCASLTKSE